MRTCREMGIETVALYTDFDSNALHVRRADHAVRIESYLNIETILDAAQQTSADAIHPGYGFLAENADFAAACEHAGIVFIGPRSDVIRAIGIQGECADAGGISWSSGCARSRRRRIPGPY